MTRRWGCVIAICVLWAAGAARAGVPDRPRATPASPAPVSVQFAPGAGGAGGPGAQSHHSAPDPDPAPDPHPGPDPGPDPGPHPGPDPDPAPHPSPGPDPAPDPGPGPDPAPGPEPEPGPTRPGIRVMDRDGRAERAASMMTAATRLERALPSGRPEILVVGRAAEVARAEREIAGFNGAILRRQTLATLGIAVSAVDIGALMTPPILRARLARKGIEVTLDRNALYGPAEPGRSYAQRLVGLPDLGSCRLRRPVRIGVIDGPADVSNGALAGIPVLSRSVLDEGETAAGPGHATGLLSLIAADPRSGPPAGLAPGADIYLAVAFARNGSGSEMRLDHLIAAFDWLIGQGVEVVNMSLAGPRNAVLAELMSAAHDRGLILVAAAGNDGRDRVAFPAADPHVISVTAIDALKRRFRSANVGREIDFAAPGVEVLVAGPEGRSYRSGTSYAAAIATALVAHEVARGNATSAAAERALAARAEDLGAPGRDDEYGWGLIRLGGC